MKKETIEMKRKIFTVVLFMLMCSVGVSAQSVDIIKADTSYVYGEGSGSTVNTADREALENILQQIKLTVVHDSELNIKNVQ